MPGQYIVTHGPDQQFFFAVVECENNTHPAGGGWDGKYVQQLAIGPPRQKKYFDLEVDCLRRGVYRLPYVDIYRHDIFGMGVHQGKMAGLRRGRCLSEICGVDL